MQQNSCSTKEVLRMKTEVLRREVIYSLHWLPSNTTVPIIKYFHFYCYIYVLEMRTFFVQTELCKRQMRPNGPSQKALQFCRLWICASHNQTTITDTYFCINIGFIITEIPCYESCNVWYMNTYDLRRYTSENLKVVMTEIQKLPSKTAKKYRNKIYSLTNVSISLAKGQIITWLATTWLAWLCKIQLFVNV